MIEKKQSNNKVINGFSLLELLGEGSFSQVYKVSRPSDDQLYAMKIVRLNRLTEKEINNALNEVRILASINHPNIIAFKETFHDQHSNKLCIIMELANGGDLLKIIQQAKATQNYISEELIWNWAAQMITGLKTLHDKGIVHRDFKPANIYLQQQSQSYKHVLSSLNNSGNFSNYNSNNGIYGNNNNISNIYINNSNNSNNNNKAMIFFSPHSKQNQDQYTERSSIDFDYCYNGNIQGQNNSSQFNQLIKIGDLNISKIIKDCQELASTQAGTPFYASPEIWSNNPYSFKSDIWSLGCVIYELCALSPPFQASDLASLYGKIIKGKYPKIPSIYSNEIDQLINSCLQLNPEDRLDCGQILKHPLILKNVAPTPTIDSPLQQQISFQLEKKQQGRGSLSQQQLIQTIKAPKDLRLLKERLPKSNYQYQNFVSFQQQYQGQQQQLQEQNMSCEKGQQQQQKKQPIHCSPVRSISIGDHINNSYNVAAVAAAAAAAVAFKLNKKTEAAQANNNENNEIKRRYNVLTEISNCNISPRKRKMGSVSPKRKLNLKINNIQLDDIVSSVENRNNNNKENNNNNNCSNCTNLPSIINRGNRNNSNNNKISQIKVSLQQQQQFMQQENIPRPQGPSINYNNQENNTPMPSLIHDQNVRLRSGRRLRQYNPRKNILNNNIFQYKKKLDNFNLDQISKNLENEILQINKIVCKLR